MRQRMRLPLNVKRPVKAPEKGTLVGVFKLGGRDGRARTYKYLATGEDWKTVNDYHTMKREPGRPQVRVNDGYHYLPTKRVLVNIAG